MRAAITCRFSLHEDGSLPQEAVKLEDAYAKRHSPVDLQKELDLQHIKAISGIRAFTVRYHQSAHHTTF